jgi:PadR family transcriptional regulator PadR
MHAASRGWQLAVRNQPLIRIQCFDGGALGRLLVMHLLGSFEQAVLLAVLRLRADAYGRAILRDIRQKLGDDVTSGAVYVTLDRLEAKGLLTSRSTADGRRYFAVLTSGTRALEKTKEIFDRVWDGFE